MTEAKDTMDSKVSTRRNRGLRLDQHQVRTWTSWQRYTTLVLVVFAFRASSPPANTDRRARRSAVRPCVFP